MKHYYIYALSNSVTKQVIYIGRSTNPKARNREHKSNSLNPKSKQYNYPLYVAIRELQNAGQDFVMDIIEKDITDLKVAKLLENQHIAQYRQDFNLINQRGGGDIVDGHADDTKRKMSETKLKNNKSSEHTENIRKANKARGKAVVQLTKAGSFIAFHKIISDAARTVDCSKNNISNCCNKKRFSAGGFKWMFASEYNLANLHDLNNNRTHQVVAMMTGKAA